MVGTAIITWHDGKPRYDEVMWDPNPSDQVQAAALARYKLRVDKRATKVHVSYTEYAFVEAIRCD